MSQSNQPGRIPGSFRDPAGFLFVRDGTLYRQINEGYSTSYQRLMTSGLYQALVDAGDLVSHEECAPAEASVSSAWKLIQPERIPFVSWPFEWSFGQLKAAALLTLRIQRQAVARGMSLRDASAYNVQFQRGRPVLIDTLSFGPYIEGEPWVAYQQFCRHFLAPLALMAMTDVRLGQLSRVHIDGVPLDLAVKLLPFSSKLRFGLLMHLHLHAGSSTRHADDGVEPTKKPTPGGVSRAALLGLIDSLEGAVSGLDWAPAGTEWADYYATMSYTEASHQHKRELVASFLAKIAPKQVWDLGANTGVFSRIAAESGARVLAFDVDPGAVERHWRDVVARSDESVLPLLQDLTNPSGGVGWGNDERASLGERGPADAVMALALIHHLAISNNVPLDRVAAFFRTLGRQLIIEFVPKSDVQVRRLLATREDVFPDYTIEGFEAAFQAHFRVVERESVRESDRVLFWMEALS
ncbi:MAG: SAM-dependent methyltransferase [Myxococcales bacterium]|nr:SAM-dependent methyltransferase [Myxococcales bacterium]